jgi:glucan 1,3-beta-glucosidase
MDSKPCLSFSRSLETSPTLICVVRSLLFSSLISDMHSSVLITGLLTTLQLAFAQHVHLEIPEVKSITESMLRQFSEYTAYTGPTAAIPSAAPASSSAAATDAPSLRTQSLAAADDASCSYWLEDIKHQGYAAFNANPGSYQVFRNVKDFGAVGDGVTDDTAAIQDAISSGGRCAPGSCASTTVTPAVVYFPAGTYLINASITDYYYTQMIGNPNCLPIIKASADFAAPAGNIGLIDGDPYGANGLQYGSTNVFWRQIRNFILDMTAMPAGAAATGIHWPTGQATSIQNVVFEMNQDAGTQHQGIFIESGSGGFMNDLTFNGGLYGLNVGNQQFTMRNMTFNNIATAINQIWDWGWTYYGITVNNCSIGLDIYAGGPTALSVGSVTFFDSSFTDVGIAFRTGYTSNSQPPTANSLILENISLKRTPIAVQDGNNKTALRGTPRNTLITAWGEGHSYTPNGPNSFQGTIAPAPRPAGLITTSGAYYQRSKPQYEQYSASNFVSARNQGAKGDGVTDDTKALQKAINNALKSNKILFVDHGDYLVTSTIYIPPGSRIVGESFSVILSSGSFFDKMNAPKPVVQIGKPGDQGVVEWSDMIVSTKGRQRGAILFEYNINSPSTTPTGVWDVHARIGGFAGSNLQLAQCPTTPSKTTTSANLVKRCISGYLTVHITTSAAGLYLENDWIWVADHDVEDPSLRQITVYAGRGLLDESTTGPIWLVGTAVEHHVKYEYQFVNTQNVFAGQVC